MSRSDTASGSMRTSQRFSTNSVEWEYGGVINMSTTGACIVDKRTMTTLAPGVTQTLRFCSEGRTLTLQAQVKWARRSSSAEGMLAGVVFTSVSAKQTIEIERFAGIRFSDAAKSAERTADSMNDEPETPVSHEPAGELVDLYRVLGIRPDASESDIRGAFRRNASRWHPDTCSSPEAAERFVEVSKAYKVLRDAQARGRYDSMLRTSEAKKAPAATSDTDRRDKGRLVCSEITCSLGEVVNASSTGLQVVGRKRFGHRKGKTIKFTLKDGTEKLDMVAEIAWAFDVGKTQRRLGLQLELSTDAERRQYWEFVRNSSQVVGSVFHTSASAKAA